MPKFIPEVGFPLLLAVTATAALAEGATENPTLSPTGTTWTGNQASVGLAISTKTDQTLVLRRATLVDNAGHVYEVSGEPVGIRTDVGGSCVLGTLILAASPQAVTIPFRVSGSQPPFTLGVELETPDPSPRSGCRAFKVSVHGFQGR